MQLCLWSITQVRRKKVEFKGEFIEVSTQNQNSKLPTVVQIEVNSNTCVPRICLSPPTPRLFFIDQG